MNKVNSIFKKDKALIGMVHLLPLAGYREHTTIDDVIEKALYDMNILEKTGFDGFMIENNYDLPHKIFVDEETKRSFLHVTQVLAKEASLPFGICVLWNDYITALDIAKEVGGKFIRVAAFVDNVRTSYGDVYGEAAKVLAYRKKIQAEDIFLFTDVQVKHSELLNIRAIEESTRDAMENGSDGIIVTGKWTGDAPKTDDLLSVHSIIKDKLPLIIGSGATIENLPTLLKFSDIIVVGTSIKTGENMSKTENVNLKPYSARLNFEKASDFAKKFAEYTYN